MIRTTSRRPLDLTAVRGRLDRWRRTRAHARSPIPPALWADAVALARQQGLYRTARALRLDYGGLKHHVEAADGRRGAGRPTFVEVAGSTLTDLGSCVIELTGPGGTVRLRVPGLALADLAALTRTLAGA
ncbi:MAG TPA: hypothetical protein VGX75_14640 [bacterium]|nr:hypothetical protein [bacterium]